MGDTNMEPSLDLLIRAQSGDKDAQNDLVSRYLPRLTRWARGRLPTSLRSMLDTGDLVQDALINALRNLDTLEIRDEGTFQWYLARAVRNRIIDLYRKKARQPIRGELPEDAVADTPSPIDRAIGAENRAWYERALMTLSEEEQTLIFLSLELGLTAKEIAEQLGKPSPDAARMAVNRARERLEAEMRRLR